MDNRIAPTQISSGDKLSDIEHHFRVSAGPGAGKTHWLVNHIKEVLHTSERLDKSRKVACITYTNTAVEIIRNRLGSSANQVEVSTIHSFLYRHIIKPYMHFIADDFGFDVSRLDGHEELKVFKKKVKAWIKNHPNKGLLKSRYSIDALTKRPENLNKIARWLSTLTYEFNEENALIFKADKNEGYIYIDGKREFLNKEAINILGTDFKSFKEEYWKEGILHHDDVLFFSYQLISRYPFILNVLRAKFPYFFIDEFQDSNPIQVELLRRIGEQETIIGIIGDKAQSIFNFQGADSSQFEAFNLEGIRDYIISNNRRSTRQIIDFLNHIRPDFIQQGQDGFVGSKPVIYIGERLNVLKAIKDNLSEEDLITLSRKNIIANALKNDVEGINLDKNLFEKLKNVDSPDRSRLIMPCIKAIELCRENKIKEALKELKKYFGRSEQSKKDALELLLSINGKYHEYCDESLITVYNILLSFKNDKEKFKNFTKFPKLQKGKAPYLFYENTNYKDLSLCVNIVEDTSQNITIHKSKGAEFNNVLLVLEDEKELDFITSPNLNKYEEHRLRYVAVSRAIENLYITVPELSEAEEEKIKVLDLINITRVDDSI